MTQCAGEIEEGLTGKEMGEGPRRREGGSRKQRQWRWDVRRTWGAPFRWRRQQGRRTSTVLPLLSFSPHDACAKTSSIPGTRRAEVKRREVCGGRGEARGAPLIGLCRFIRSSPSARTVPYALCPQCHSVQVSSDIRWEDTYALFPASRTRIPAAVFRCR